MSTDIKAPGQAPDPGPRPGDKYEKRDFKTDFVWSFIWSLLGLMVAGIVVSFILYAGYFRVWTSRDATSQPSRLAAGLPARPPEPRLQDLPAQDLREFREHEREAQTSYGWVEPEAGVVRIPVERAMELVLERGLPVRGAEGSGERGLGKAKALPAKSR